MVRLFVCIWIPDCLRERLIKFQGEIKTLPIKAKYVEPENMHLTVTFLGEVENREIEPLKERIEGALKDVNSFHVKLVGLKLIPNENYIRVIGINAKDDKEEISQLIRKITGCIGGNFYESAKLTLCRVKYIKDRDILRKFFEKYRNVEVGEFEVKSVALVKSTLTGQGPIYETIHESFLKPLGS